MSEYFWVKCLYFGEGASHQPSSYIMLSDEKLSTRWSDWFSSRRPGIFNPILFRTHNFGRMLTKHPINRKYKPVGPIANDPPGSSDLLWTGTAGHPPGSPMPVRWFSLSIASAWQDILACTNDVMQRVSFEKMFDLKVAAEHLLFRNARTASRWTLGK